MNFCSHECHNNQQREYRTCVSCGNVEKVKKSKYEHNSGWVCSDECNKKKYRNYVTCVSCSNEKEELSSKTEKRKIPYRCSSECVEDFRTTDVNCDTCGDTFAKNKYNVKRSDYHYCSNECQKER